jgi:hypothetical protein
MASWKTRKEVGDALEQTVAEELTLRGWTVNPWGQGILTGPVRGALHRTDTALRWTPDLVAARGEIVVFIDCKGQMTSGTTDRHCIERAAVRAHLQLVALMELPVYYVFDGLGVLTPHEVMMAGRIGPHTNVGSGAPYYLVSAQLARPFDRIFGPHEQLAMGQLAA